MDGKVRISSAKNAVLPIVAGCFLCDEPIVIKNCPRLTDIEAMLRIIESTGGRAEYIGGDIAIDCRFANPSAVGAGLTGGIRSSVFVLGPLLARYRKAAVSYPGGCEIGLRPIDLHIEGLRRLNVAVSEENGLIICDGSNMRAGEIDLDFPSVGATENLMMAAAKLPGKTLIRNAAREPEVADLAAFINAMGGKIHGAGTDTITVEGVKRLNGCEYSPIPDRIAGGTFMIACAIAGGDVFADNLRPSTVSSLSEKLIRCGLEVEKSANALRVRSDGSLRAIHKIETQPYPGFPTDLQAQMVAMLSRADGCSLMVENLFENRYKYTVQLNKMGARITVKDRVALVKGVRKLHGGAVTAEDLRGGAALVLAALGAEGETVVSGINHIDRGYFRLEEDLCALGASVKREKLPLP